MQVLKELAPHVPVLEIVQRLGGTTANLKPQSIVDLFKLLQLHPEWTENELARALFGQSRSATHPAYQALIKEATWAVLQEYLYPRGRYVSSPSRMYLQLRCDRMLALIDELSVSLNDAELNLWQKLEKAASRCDYVSVELLSLNRQLRYFSFQRLDENKNKLLKNRINVLELVQNGITLCKSSAIRLRNADGENVEHISAQTLKEIGEFVNHHAYYDIQVYGGEVLISTAVEEQRFVEALRVIDKVSLFINKRFQRETDVLVTLAFQRLLCHIATKNYPEGKKAWYGLLKVSKGNSSRKSSRKVIEAGMLLHLRCEVLNDIDDLLQSFDKPDQISSFSNAEKGRWYALFSCLQLIVQFKKHPLPQINPYTKKLSRNIQNINILPTDRTMTEIITACQLIISGNYRKAQKTISKIDEKSPRRLTSGSPEYRKNIFVNLLREVAKANFHPAAIKRKTAVLESKLFASAECVTWASLSTELVSFTTLWLNIKNALLEEK